MTILLSRIVLTLVVCGFAAFAVHRIWTRKPDLLAFLSAPAQAIPVVDDPISVSRSTIEVEFGRWERTSTFSIQNDSDRRRHAIVAILAITRGKTGDQSGQGNLYLKHGDGRRFVSASKTDFNPEIFSVAGFVDGNPAWMLFINSLGPKEELPLALVTWGPEGAEATPSARIGISVGPGSETPTDLLRSEQTYAWKQEVKTPRPFTFGNKLPDVLPKKLQK